MLFEDNLTFTYDCRGTLTGRHHRPMRAVMTGIWVVAALVFVAMVAIVCARAWLSVGDTQITLIGWLSMGFGIVLTLGLGIGLMSLVFISNRRGYDNAGHFGREDH